MYFNLEEEAPSSLYVAGDCWYVVNAAVYTLCAMRDNECFWFMPVHGKPQCLIDIARAHYYSEGIGGRDREGVTDCLIASPKAKSVGKGSKKSRGRSDSLDSTDSTSNGDGSTSMNHSPCTLSRSPSPANGSAEGTRERGKGAQENGMEKLSNKFLMGSAVSGSVNLRSVSVTSNGNVSNSSNSNSNGSGSGNVNGSAQSSSREREGSSKDSVKDSSSSSSSSSVSGSIGGVGASLFSIAGYTRRNEWMKKGEERRGEERRGGKRGMCMNTWMHGRREEGSDEC
jgi:hypothetical protein